MNGQLSSTGWQCNIECMKESLNQIRSMVGRRDLDVKGINENIDNIYKYIYEMIGYWGPYKGMTLDDFINTEIIVPMFK